MNVGCWHGNKVTLLFNIPAFSVLLSNKLFLRIKHFMHLEVNNLPTVSRPAAPPWQQSKCPMGKPSPPSPVTGRSQRRLALLSGRCTELSLKSSPSSLLVSEKPSGDKAGLWDDVVHFVVGRVCCQFVVADGHFMSVSLKKERK